VPAAGKPAATKIRISKTTILIVVLVAVGLWLFYNWSTSAYSVDETKARNLIETLVREEMVISHACKPNQTVLKAGTWRSLRSAQTRETFMKAFSRVCISEGGGPSMVVLEGDRRVAEFDGWNVK